jgi:hypothetical protein
MGTPSLTAADAWLSMPFGRGSTGVEGKTLVNTPTAAHVAHCISPQQP